MNELASNSNTRNPIIKKLLPTLQADIRAALQGTKQIQITVTGRTSRQAISLPVWFVWEGDKLYLLPTNGTETQWFQNLCKTPSIHLSAKGKTFYTTTTPITDAALVSEVVKKFQEKYGVRRVNRLYSRLEVAIEVALM